MNGIDVGDFRRRDDGGHIQIALRRSRRADADRLIGKTDVERVAVRFAVDGDGTDPQFFAGADDAKCDFAAIGDEQFSKHRFQSGTAMETQGEERLAVFDRLAIGDQTLDDFPGCIRFDLVHELHGLDDAEHLAVLNLVPNLDKGRGTRRRRLVKRAHDRRLDDVQRLLLFGRSVRRSSRRSGRHGMNAVRAGGAARAGPGANNCTETGKIVAEAGDPCC